MISTLVQGRSGTRPNQKALWPPKNGSRRLEIHHCRAQAMKPSTGEEGRREWKEAKKRTSRKKTKRKKEKKKVLSLAPHSHIALPTNNFYFPAVVVAQAKLLVKTLKGNTRSTCKRQSVSFTAVALGSVETLLCVVVRVQFLVDVVGTSM